MIASMIDGITNCQKKIMTSTVIKRLFGQGKISPSVLTKKKAGYIVLLVYLLIGIFIFKDYGISTDEGTQRNHSLVTYKYLITNLLNNRDVSETVNKALGSVADLPEYGGRFYGVALHIPLVFIEHMTGFTMDISSVFQMRHFYNFINYLLGCLCFYLILWKRFEGGHVPFIGLLMLALYPRFFAESFYNNKDILFASWYIISIYCALRFIEKGSLKNTLLFSAALAICTNTRIIGITILFLCIAFYIFKMLVDKELADTYAKSLFIMLIAFFAFYVLITPASWDNPLKFILDTLFQFSYYDEWNGTHLYLGERISKNVPWHYIPVWIAVTIPTIYTLLFVIGFVAVIICFFMEIKKNEITKTFKQNKNVYDIFIFCAFWCSLVGMILLKVKLYDAWRHVYFLFIPLLYLSVIGFNFLLDKFSYKKIITVIINTIISIVLISSGVWIIKNHPNEYVYYNPLVRSMVAKYFLRDTWAVSNSHLLKYIVDMDERENITVASSSFSPQIYYLPNDERKRIIRRDIENGSDYYIQRSRNSTTNDWRFKGYEEIYNISVDGFKLSALFKYVIDDSMFDEQLTSNIHEMTSNKNENELFNSIDNDMNTRWMTDRPQGVDDYVLIEFKEAANYNVLRFEPGQHINDYPRELHILTSMDGQNWTEMKLVWNNRKDYIFEDGEYKFIKLVNKKEDDKNNRWSIYELKMGNLDSDTITRIVFP